MNPTSNRNKSLNPKIAITTDVRFWRRQTGAEQRIFSLATFLQGSGFQVSVCFTSSINGLDQELDSELIEATGWDVISLIDDWKPEGFVENVLWQTKCIVNAALPKKLTPKSQNLPKSFVDFESKEISKRFENYLAKAKPDIVIVEYLTLSYLVPSPEKRKGVKYVIDTHDVLSTRNRLFKENGFDHWVDVSVEEESQSLLKFDLIIAIQSEEANTFTQMVEGNVPVVVAGHPIQGDAKNVCRGTITENSRVTFGFLASNNFVNRLSIEWFFDQVWPVFCQRLDTEAIVAGSVCEGLSVLPKNASLVGRIAEVADFYSQIDVVVNPMQFGTGLKIKSIEAMAFGKPLIATAQGLAGLNGSVSSPPWWEANTRNEWIESMSRLIDDAQERVTLSEKAVEYSKSLLQPEVVFHSLQQELLKVCRPPSSSGD